MKFSLLSTGVALASLVSYVNAQCSAVGSMGTFSGIQGQSGVTGNSVVIFKDGKVIGTHPYKGNNHAAFSDTYLNVYSQLPYTVVWWGKLKAGSTRVQYCKINYADQKGIEGTPTSSTHFYGIGVSTDSSCKVDFKC